MWVTELNWKLFLGSATWKRQRTPESVEIGFYDNRLRTNRLSTYPGHSLSWGSISWTLTWMTCKVIVNMVWHVAAAFVHLQWQCCSKNVFVCIVPVYPVLPYNRAEAAKVYIFDLCLTWTMIMITACSDFPVEAERVDFLMGYYAVRVLSCYRRLPCKLLIFLSACFEFAPSICRCSVVW